MRINYTVRILVLTSLSLGASTAQTATSIIMKAANSFLGTLDDKQRQSVVFAFDDEEQRKRWSNLPTGAVPRAGVSLKAMAPAQRAAAMTLMSLVLSARGNEKVQQIMDADEVLKTNEGAGRKGGGGRRVEGLVGLQRGMAMAAEVDAKVTARR